MTMPQDQADLDCTREFLLEYALCENCKVRNKKELEAKKAVEVLPPTSSRRAESRIDQHFLPFDSDHSSANHALMHWMGNHVNESVLLASPSGAGKTRVLCHYALKELSRGTVLYYRSADMMDDLAAAFTRKESYGKHLLWKISTVDLLIIDDLFKEAISDTRIMRLWQIIDQRYIAWEQEKMIRAGRGFQWQKRGWKTWISTNWGADELVARMGEQNGAPILRRMIDMCQIWKG